MDNTSKVVGYYMY